MIRRVPSFVRIRVAVGYRGNFDEEDGDDDDGVKREDTDD